MVFSLLLAAAAAAATSPSSAFAFSNKDGTKLLALAPVAEPARLTKASCDGKLVDILFVKQQPKGDSDTGHQTAENFEQSEGALFKLKAGAVGADASCLLATDAFFKEHAPASVSAASGPCSAADQSAAAALGKRKVTSCANAGTFAGGKLLSVQFAADGASMLAGFVLLGDKLSAMRAFPATHSKDSQDCWRADDGCTFDAKSYHVPFVLPGPGGPVLFGLWDGPEGQDLELLELQGAALNATSKANRYWAAE